MRSLVVGLFLLGLPPAASAAERLPTFPKDTPYPEARGRLIRMGIEPVSVKARRAEDPGPCPYDTLFCQTYKEVLACGVGDWMQYCTFLFRRRSDGQLVIVRTAGQANTSVSPADFRGIIVFGIAKAGPDDLVDVIIANDDRKDRR